MVATPSFLNSRDILFGLRQSFNGVPFTKVLNRNTALFIRCSIGFSRSTPPVGVGWLAAPPVLPALAGSASGVLFLLLRSWLLAFQLEHCCRDRQHQAPVMTDQSRESEMFVEAASVIVLRIDKHREHAKLSARGA